MSIWQFLTSLLQIECEGGRKPDLQLMQKHCLAPVAFHKQGGWQFSFQLCLNFMHFTLLVLETPSISFPLLFPFLWVAVSWPAQLSSPAGPSVLSVHWLGPSFSLLFWFSFCCWLWLFCGGFGPFAAQWWSRSRLHHRLQSLTQMMKMDCQRRSGQLWMHLTMEVEVLVGLRGWRYLAYC